MCRKILLITTFLVGFAAVHSKPSFVVTSTEKTTDKNDVKESDAPVGVPKIYDMQITSNVSNRFSRTLVASRVKNYDEKSRETSFSVVLPETAYISGFVLEVGGKSYEAYVKEKEEAKKDYDTARQQGLSAGHVAANARDSNRFDVSVNLEPQSKAAFLLTYEELLQRENNQYEIVINIHPGQPVQKMAVEVNINESRPLKFVRAPAIRSGNEISKFTKEELDPRAEIVQTDNKTAKVSFEPNVERQKQIASSLGTKEEEGLAGQFVVQYDVERDPKGGEVLLQDGYFVHFFAPADVPPLPKQVVFVLDTSGSMYDRKISQLIQAMKSILGDLKESDIFNIVEFNTIVKVHDLKKNDTVNYGQDDFGYEIEKPQENKKLEDIDFPAATTVNPDTIKTASETVSRFVPMGGTNIYAALEVAVRLVELARKSSSDTNRHQPLIMFLTDGDPTVGISNTQEIISKISEINVGAKHAPIFSLSFGDGADKNFLQKLSLKNQGFSRHIYEAADASLQLEDFYRQISSPLLTDVNFKYTPSVSKLTKTKFPLLFGGSELVVAGTVDSDFQDMPEVEAWGIHGPITLKPTISRPVTHLERLWAYLTVKQILEAKELSDNKTAYDKMALDLALKYSFVTPVSSLVVVKPNNTDGVVEPVAADTNTAQGQAAYSLGLSGLGGGGSWASSASQARGSFAAYPQIGSAYGAGGFSGPPVSSNFAPQSALAFLPQPESVQETEDSDYQSTPCTLHRPNTLQTTTVVASTIAEEVTSLEKLKSELPWIENLLTGNDTITTQKGTYKLGLNESIPDGPECPNTPENGNGKCALLHECPSMLSLITNVNIFQQYVCDVQGYAGICCPVNKYEKKA